MSVLIVEDDERICRGVRGLLRDRGLTVTAAATVRAALEIVERASFRVVVVNSVLPDGSGLDVVDRVRGSSSDAHAIVLSDSSTDADRVEAMRRGANDYVIKPILLRELTARVLAVRRPRNPNLDACLRVGPLAIDLVARSAVAGDQALELTDKEFDLLAYLAARPGHIFSRDQLLKAVWQVSPDSHHGETVAAHIKRLRAKIENDPRRPTLLRTVRTAGYQLDRRRDEGNDEHPQQPSTGVLIQVDGRVVSADRTATEMMGCAAADDLVGALISELAAPASQHAAGVRMAMTASGHTARTQLFDLRRLDGTEVCVEVATAAADWNGRPARRVTWTYAPDPSSRLRRLMTGVLGDLTDAVIITDLHFHVRSWNRAAERLYGWQAHEVLGRHILDVLQWVGDNGLLAAAWASLETEGRWHGEGRQITRDGSVIAVLATTNLVRDDSGEAVGIVSVNRPAPTTASIDAQAESTGAEDRIRSGLADDEFEVHYQPVVALDGLHVLAVEALVRWNHPERGLLNPIAFIEVAEHSGLIRELGQVVLAAACRQTALWRRGGADVELSVNLSTRQLADPRLVEQVTAVLADSGLDPGALWFEVTESALVEDVDTAIIVLGRLVDLGIRIAIDDFGTGWASLTYLRNFPVHALKIDRSFTSGVGRNPNDTAIVRSILSLGAELGVAVIAEGIETPAQELALRRLGCTLGQGYLYGRPGPPAHIELDHTGRNDSTNALSPERPPQPSTHTQVRPLDSVLAEATAQFLEMAATGRPQSAIDLALELLAEGHTVDRLIVDLFSPVMRQVGVLWQANRWTAADEHAVTAVVDDALAAIATAARPRHSPIPPRGSVLVACAEHEYHALPARMGAERLRSDGWDVRYLGANVPAQALKRYAESTHVDIVVVSCTVARSLLGAARSIAALVELGTPVVAAGAGFGNTSVRADRLGASGWIHPRGDPTAALNADLDPPRPPRAHNDQGMQLESHAGDLARACMAEMFERIPRMRTYSMRQLAHVRADLDNAVHHLAIAVELDDPAVFHDHVSWLTSVRDSRHLPPSILYTAIDIVADVVAQAGYRPAGRICTAARIRAVNDNPDPTPHTRADFAINNNHHARSGSSSPETRTAHLAYRLTTVELPPPSC